MKLNTILVCILVWLFLSACGGAAAPTESAPVAPIKLKVAILPFIGYAPFFIAQEEGFFAEQGLEVEFVKIERSAEGIPALLQGELDVYAGTLNVALLNAMAHNVDLKLVADKGFYDAKGCTYGAILVRKDLNVNSPADLKGLTVSVNPLSNEGYQMDKLLSEVHLEIKDIKVSSIPNTSFIEAMKQGSMDVIVVSEPWVTRLVDSGIATVWKTSQEITPDAEFSGTFYATNLLKNNPEAGYKFMAALLKGMRQYNQGKTERNVEIVTKGSQLDEALVKETCWPTMRDDGQINVQSILDFQDWAIAQGHLDQKVTVEQFWDPQFINEANKVLGK